MPRSVERLPLRKYASWPMRIIVDRRRVCKACRKVIQWGHSFFDGGKAGAVHTHCAFVPDAKKPPEWMNVDEKQEAGLEE